MSGVDVAASFRQKASYMKLWKPASTPSNRDRLELYALHKQAVHGDAPSTLTNQANSMAAADRAKYQAWRAKSGIAKDEAMRLYLAESDRQIRVYGTRESAVPAIQASSASGGSDSEQAGAARPNQPQAGSQSHQEQPRGLAAIPLLCAAASESRQGYLRRMSATQISQAWWRRQEPLTATPGSLYAIPEQLLLAAAGVLEFIALQPAGVLIIPQAVVQSFLWPLHNTFLALWMELILIATALTAASELTQTIFVGSRRTGLSLQVVLRDEVQFTSQTIRTVTEAHQPMSARLVGLMLWPYSGIVRLTAGSGLPVLYASILYVVGMCMTGWYWIVFLPILSACLMGFAIMAGNCFALIELASV